ncbi:U-box domain-containing protein 40-like isoform X1 [Asparagus officinalis]|uniref:U-box domain-containing protein 40-like isoform X1 n=1 Tax=Asparagus officinalis TaxID=4686 RepID=UPI00098E5AF2|nr:U-box domain-containing protein 40-like isoform X1 [Asparagus officinalis]
MISSLFSIQFWQRFESSVKISVANPSLLFSPLFFRSHSKMARGRKPTFKFSFFKAPPNPEKVEKVSVSGPKSSMMQSFNHGVSKFISSSPFSTLCLPPLASRTQQDFHGPPSEFQCPITGSLLYDPITHPNGSTLERVFIEAFREFNYIPSSPFDLTTNEELKSKILEWCDLIGHPRPRPISLEEACRCTEGFLAFYDNFQSGFTKVSEDDNGRYFLNSRNQLSPSSSSSKGDETNVSPLREFKKIIREPDVKKTSPRITYNRRPPSYFSEAMEAINRSKTAVPDSISTTETIDVDPIKEVVMMELKNENIEVRLQALIMISSYARQHRHVCIALCTHDILRYLLPKLHPRHPEVLITQTAIAFAILSEEPSNRITIVESGVISRLVSILKNSDTETRDIAALVIHNLALEERNKEVIGSGINVISALVSYFCKCKGDYIGRRYAGMTLCNLTINFGENLMRLAMTSGAVHELLKLMVDTSSMEAMRLGGFAMVLMSKLAWIKEARNVLVRVGAVENIMKMMKEGTGDGECCLAVMYQIQTCEDNRELFKLSAICAEAGKVLSQDREEWGETGREMAKRMLEFIRIDNHQSPDSSLQ